MPVEGHLSLYEGYSADALAVNERVLLAQKRLECSIWQGARVRREQGLRGGCWRVLLVIPFVVDAE